MYSSIEVHRHSDVNPWTYRDLDLRQRVIAEQVRAAGHATVVLSEVAPVITLGRRCSPDDLLLPREALAMSGIELVETDRGGLATYHGPGQWVLFPVHRLEDLTGDPKGVRKMTQILLEVALEVGREYDPQAEIRWGCETGVWTRRGKFAAVGVHIEQGILLHGLSVNGFRTPLSFQGLRPCGLDLPVDYLLGGTGESEFIKLGEALLAVMLRRFLQGSAHKGLTIARPGAITGSLRYDGS